MIRLDIDIGPAASGRSSRHSRFPAAIASLRAGFADADRSDADRDASIRYNRRPLAGRPRLDGFRAVAATFAADEPSWVSVVAGETR